MGVKIINGVYVDLVTPVYEYSYENWQLRHSLRLAFRESVPQTLAYPRSSITMTHFVFRLGINVFLHQS